ncbi:MAG: type II CAAX endopeptidase family protein [Synechococcales bacterium]|nr:type II CAAX endopeptidase family protein [Synechococcales bacterium]
MRIVLFLLILAAVWVPIALPLRLFIRDDNLASIVTMVILYGEFLIGLQVWNRWVWTEARPLQRYGFRQARLNGVNLLAGLCLGLGSVLALFFLQGDAGWQIWQVPPAQFARIVLEAFVMAVPLGFAEELLFRGWLWDELARNYSSKTVMGATSLIFAIAHFIKPIEAIVATWLTFPALLMLGVALAGAKQWGQGRMGLPIGLHAGLVGGYYILNVGQLMQPNPASPTWLTGMGGNPLASLPGVVALSAIALLIYELPRSKR